MVNSIRIAVRVQPNARVNKVEQIGTVSYRVSTTATPEAGKANQAVVKLLAKHLDVAPSLITLVSGANARDKVFEIPT